MMFKKYFTPQEAKKRLPLIKQIVQDILGKGQRLKILADEYKGREPPVEYHRLTSQIEVLILELEDLGCFFKDWNFEIGLVDFPAMIADQEVFLCWRSDEVEISFYHPIQEGYSSRRPIPYF